MRHVKIGGSPSFWKIDERRPIHRRWPRYMTPLGNCVRTCSQNVPVVTHEPAAHHGQRKSFFSGEPPMSLRLATAYENKPDCLREGGSACWYSHRQSKGHYYRERL